MATPTLQHNYDAAMNTGFRNKVQMAIIEMALNIQSEATSGLFVPPGIPLGGSWGADATTQKQELHNRRSNLAIYVLHDPNGFATMFCNAVTMNLNLYPDAGNSIVFKAIDDSEPTTADIENSISAVWNALAIDLKA